MSTRLRQIASAIPRTPVPAGTRLHSTLEPRVGFTLKEFLTSDGARVSITDSEVLIGRYFVSRKDASEMVSFSDATVRLPRSKRLSTFIVWTKWLRSQRGTATATRPIAVSPLDGSVRRFIDGGWSSEVVLTRRGVVELRRELDELAGRSPFPPGCGPHRIQPPHYVVAGHALNEYELRHLMVQVARGEVPSGFEVTDHNGNTTTIRPDGRFVGRLDGLDISARYTLDLVDASTSK